MVQDRHTVSILSNADIADDTEWPQLPTSSTFTPLFTYWMWMCGSADVTVVICGCYLQIKGIKHWGANV